MLSCSRCEWKGRFEDIKERTFSNYFLDWTCPACGWEQAAGGLSEAQLPSRVMVESDDPRARPRLRCGLCAWSEGLPEPFGLQLPELISLNEAKQTGRTSGYPDWATLETRDDGDWYVHRHCGRSTHDLAEVTGKPELTSIDVMGTPVAVVLERWRRADDEWTSVALAREEVGDSIPDRVEVALHTLLGLGRHEGLLWESTERFHFGRPIEDPLHFKTRRPGHRGR